MRELVAIAVGLGILLYVMRNERAPLPKKPKRENFEVEVLQNALNQIQSQDKNIYPVDTVYFNKREEGGYSGRFMFFNTKEFYGVQYDVDTNEDGTIINSIRKMVSPEYSAPFSGYSKKFEFSNLLSVQPPKVNMSKIWENYKTENNR